MKKLLFVQLIVNQPYKYVEREGAPETKRTYMRGEENMKEKEIKKHTIIHSVITFRANKTKINYANLDIVIVVV